MTLNSTVRIPPRTKNVSPLRTGRYAAQDVSDVGTHLINVISTFQKVWLCWPLIRAQADDSNGITRTHLEVNLENVPTQT